MSDSRATTTPSRHKERANWDDDVINAILDEALIGHLAFVDRDRPQILPLLFVRVGRSVFLHGSTGARFSRLVKGGHRLPVSFEVTLVDGLVLARSAFSHSANYRCVIAHGDALLVADDDRKREVLEALMDKLVPGRLADARPPRRDELRQTSILELPLTEVAAKVRTGDPLDDKADLALPVWAGVRPLRTGWGTAVPSGDLASRIALPGYLENGDHDAVGVPGAMTA